LVKKFQQGESFVDLKENTHKHFCSLDEENTYLKAQVEYLK